ncbi:hypothetical protein A3743_23750 [Oleiphilus sp. HI0072]|nr:hypothetical protein A3743_23750 [Oleiphilus sp. HI0072]
MPSAANFVLAKHLDIEAEALAAGLREQSIIIRHFKQPRIKDYLRISIGTPEECQALIAGLKRLIVGSE